MDAKELLQKVRKIEIKTRGLSQNIFAGEYHTAFKGRGVIFSEVREYQPGDDIRDIDWNVTARHNKPFVKVYEEERELTMMLLIDVSGSSDFGAVGDEKKEVIAEIAATLAFSSIQNNDKVGVIFFSDRIEKFIPPKKGKKHILLIIREIIDMKPESRGTNIDVALKFMTNALKKRCTAFLLSDFIDNHDYFSSMSIANRKHDLAAIQVYDKRDARLPDVGLVRVRDMETGADRWLDTSSAKVRKAFDSMVRTSAETLLHCRQMWCGPRFGHYRRGLRESIAGIVPQPCGDTSITGSLRHKLELQMNRILRFFSVIALSLACVSGVSAKVSVSARLDSVSVLMGKLTTLNLEVVQDKGKPGGFPLFRNADINKGYVGICGDSIELRTSYKADTIDLGSNRIQINYKVPLQAFDSGSYRLPEFVYVSESDSARSNALTLNVVPVNVTADDPIAGFAQVAEPEGKSVLDALPDWMVDYWWIIIAILLAIVAFLWGMRRYKKEGTVLKKKPEPTPYETAIKDLRELKAKNLWEQGMEKEYFTRLTDILRIYLARRFGINAMEMTSREIMDHLYSSDVKDKRDYVRQILSVADFVKFAKVRPLPADNIAAYDNAVRFVEETKPVPVVAADAEEGDGQNPEIKKTETKKGGES